MLYRWRYPHRYLYAPYSLRIDMVKPPQLLAGQTDAFDTSSLLKVEKTDATQSWSFPLLVESTGDYRVQLRLSDKAPASGSLIVDFGNGDKITLDEDEEIKEFLASRSVWRITKGLHSKVTITWQGRGDGAFSPLSLLAITLSPAWEKGVSISPLAFDYIPRCPTTAVEEKGRTYLLAPNSRMIRYRFYNIGAGDHQLTFEGKNDTAGDVVFETRIDNTLQGLMQFDKRDGSWSSLGMPVFLPTGEHTLDILFIKSYERKKQKESKPEKERVFCLSGLNLRKLKPEEKPVDNRMAVANTLFRPPSFVTRGFRSLEPGSAMLPGDEHGAWWVEDPPNLLAQGIISIDPPEGEGHSPILHLNAVPGFKSVNLRTDLFPVKAGDPLYFSFRISTHNLYTHTACAQVWYFDENLDVRAPLRKDWIENLYGSNPWERWSYYDRAPEGVKVALVTFSMFVQSKPAWWQYGSALYEDLDWSVPPDPGTLVGK